MNFILAGFKIKTEGHSWVRSRLWCVSLKDWKQTSLSDDALSHFSGFHQTFFFVSLDSPNESMENVFKTNLKGFLWTANNRSGYEMFILFRAFLTFSKSFYVILVCYFAVLLAFLFLVVFLEIETWDWEFKADRNAFHFVFLVAAVMSHVFRCEVECVQAWSTINHHSCSPSSYNMTLISSHISRGLHYRSRNQQNLWQKEKFILILGALENNRLWKTEKT